MGVRDIIPSARLEGLATCRGNPARRRGLAAFSAMLAVAALLAGGCPPIYEELTTPGARVRTSMGEFVIELEPERSPASVANFQQYAMDDFYDGTVFHRVIAGKLVQGGGLTADLQGKATREPIPNESANGLSNVRGTVSLARTEDADSATSQFFINLADNVEFDFGPDNAGYTVFGKVVEGLEVLDQIGAVATENRGLFSDVPVTTVTIEDVALIDVKTGETRVTDYWEAYAERLRYGMLTFARDLLVDLLSRGF